MQTLCLASGRFRLLVDAKTGIPLSLTRPGERGEANWEFVSPEKASRGLWELEVRPKHTSTAATTTSATTAEPDLTLTPGDSRVRLVLVEQDQTQLWLTYYVLLGDGDQPALILTAVLKVADTDEICGRVEVTNLSPACCVTSIAYPLFSGIRARAAQVPDTTGDHCAPAKDAPVRETLVYPFFAGLRFDDPVATLAGKFPGPAGLGVVTARPVAGSPGLFRLQQFYCGQLSMAWMDYYARTGKNGDSAGLYLASYDPEGRMVALRVDVEQENTLGMGIVHPVRVEAGQTWISGPVSIALHDGDWHWGARRYRAFARRSLRPQPAKPAAGIRTGPAPSLLPPASAPEPASVSAPDLTPGPVPIPSPASDAQAETAPLPSRRPAWLDHSDSLMAHYDFKWQDGSFTHTFADLYPLYQRAEAEGVGHLFVAGWSSGGFDHLYPEYYPDLSLGTVMDFLDGVRQIRRSGGQVTFYTNAALFGTDSHYHPTLGERWAVRNHDLSPVRLHFFNKDFTVNCRGVAGYQRQIIDTVRWLAGEAGASGVYLDCYAAIGPYPCFSPEHGHPHPFTWNADARQLLQELNDILTRHRLDPFLMIEGCGDLYGPYLSAVLIHGWYYAYSYPEMYRYTFPEFLTVDMVYPAHGQRFRAQGISDLAYDQLHRALILGCILWFYDQEDARFCNFRTDPEMWAYIRQLLKLRAMVRPFLQHGEFLDDEGIEVVFTGQGNDSARAEVQERTRTEGQKDAQTIWRPYTGQPVVVKRFRLQQPAPVTEAATELPITTGTLLSVWRRGVETLPPPKTPGEVEVAADSLGNSEAKGFIRLRSGVRGYSSPNTHKPEAWLLTAGSTHFEPWPVELQTDGCDPSGNVLVLPLPPSPIAMILVEE